MDAASREDFDPASYQTIPRLPVAGLVALARALLALTPKLAPERVRDAASRVEAEIGELEAALGRWRQVASAQTLAEEAALDHFVDGLWQCLHMRLESWFAYERSEQLSLADTRRSKVDYRRYIARARRARAIVQHLFGEEGTAFLERGYSEQAATMAEILHMIEAGDLGETIDELVGPDLLESLRDCQVRYEAMVEARSRREQSLGLELRKLAEHMRWELTLYAINVLGLIDRSQPESLVRVRASLQPILEFRQRLRVRCESDQSGEFAIEMADKL